MREKARKRWTVGRGWGAHVELGGENCLGVGVKEPCSLCPYMGLRYTYCPQISTTFWDRDIPEEQTWGAC